MFLIGRPPSEAIDRFLTESKHLPLSYGPAGRVHPDVASGAVDEMVVTIGHGKPDFEQAKAALIAWKQFDIGWVELHPSAAAVTAGTVLAVLIRHLGMWSLNGARVLYNVGSENDETRFGVAYGTLTNHAESGEELFEVYRDSQTDEVKYRIRAFSRPQALLAALGQPVVRLLQARFRAQSAAAMTRAIGRR